MAENIAHPYGRSKSLSCEMASSPNDCWLIPIRCDVDQVVTIDVLPDDVLLITFDFHVVGDEGFSIDISEFDNQVTKPWQSLVHVCRRWRCLVFGSPRRLDLRLFCTTRTPATETLDIWPAFPLFIQGDVSETSVDNVVAELDLSNRIYQIELNCYTTSQIEKVLTAMQVSFPELSHLYLSFRGVSHVPVLPDSFLGGSAPRLRYLSLIAVPLPELPKLLWSAAHLTRLWLRGIPHSGYFSPEAMVTCLTMLTSLETLELGFESPQSCPDQESRRSLPPTHSILPTLEIFWFRGVNEYLEDLVAQIDTPRLFHLSATFFNDVDFDTPELIQFLRRSSTFKAPTEAHVFFSSRTASVKLQRQASRFADVAVEIICRVPDWQLSSLAQICTSSLPLLFTTENLFIYESVDPQLDWRDGIENIEWLELLLPFTAVKNLYLPKRFAPRIAPALQEYTGGGTTEVLPSLQNLYLEGFQPSESVPEDIERFISARQLTNHPVAISVWDRPGGAGVGDKSEEVDD